MSKKETKIRNFNKESRIDEEQIGRHQKVE